MVLTYKYRRLTLIRERAAYQQTFSYIYTYHCLLAFQRERLQHRLLIPVPDLDQYPIFFV